MNFDEMLKDFLERTKDDVDYDRTSFITTHYNIIGKIGVERFHINNVKCTKTLLGDKWVGECKTCDEFHQLWKENRAEEARKIKPIERHIFETNDEPFKCGKSLAAIIGNGTGKFNVVKTFVCGYPCYEKSHWSNETTLSK